MRQAGKEVEPLGLSGNGLCNNPSCNPGQRHTLTGKALRVVDVRTDTADVGSALHGYPDKAAPSLLYHHVLELRKNLQHPASHGGLEIRRLQLGVADPTTEEQPVIRRTSKVVQYELQVRNGMILGQQRSRTCFAQRLGRANVGANRHQSAAEFWHNPI